VVGTKYDRIQGNFERWQLFICDFFVENYLGVVKKALVE
jgi:hypothetical protein